GVRGEHERDHLRLEAPAGRKQRTDRTADHAAGEHLLLRRLAFALEEAARNPSGRVGVFPVVDGERQEIDPLARVRRAARGDDDDRIAGADDDGSTGLLGELAGFEPEGRALADGYFTGSHKQI